MCRLFDKFIEQDNPYGPVSLLHRRYLLCWPLLWILSLRSIVLLVSRGRWLMWLRLRTRRFGMIALLIGLVGLLLLLAVGRLPWLIVGILLLVRLLIGLLVSSAHRLLPERVPRREQSRYNHRDSDNHKEYPDMMRDKHKKDDSQHNQRPGDMMPIAIPSILTPVGTAHLSGDAAIISIPHGTQILSF